MDSEDKPHKSFGFGKKQDKKDFIKGLLMQR